MSSVEVFVTGIKIFDQQSVLDHLVFSDFSSLEVTLISPPKGL